MGLPMLLSVGCILLVLRQCKANDSVNGKGKVTGTDKDKGRAG